MVVGEAPGRNEDKEGKGFIGKEGELLWEELSKYDLIRRYFHVTNCVKCWPSESKTPTPLHIAKCKPWLEEELKKVMPVLTLVFGNTGLQCFKGESGGITKYNAATEWLEEYSTWVCFCLHPSAALRNRDNMILFQAGIKNFADKISILGGL
jgi:DNA polymerase